MSSQITDGDRRALREALLAAPLRAGAADGPPGGPAQAAAPAAGYEPFPLLDLQQAYWMGRDAELGLGGTACHGYLELELPGLDLDRLERAANALIIRHPMLRAVLRPDGTQQVLADVPHFAIPVLDASDGTVALAAQSVREEMSHQVLDVHAWPLFDIRVSRSQREPAARLHISFDILIADALSFKILSAELLALYHAPDRQLPPIGLTFRDYVTLVERQSHSSGRSEARKYWSDRLDALPDGPALPFVRPLDEIRSPRFTHREAVVEADRWRAVGQVAASLGVSPAALTLTVFADVLSLWAASPRFSLNLTVFDREPVHEDVQRVVGPFTTSVVLPVDTATSNVAKLARALQHSLWEALDNRRASGVWVLRELSRRRGEPVRMPVVFTYVQAGSSGGDFRDDFQHLGEVTFALSQTPQVVLDCQVSETGDQCHLWWDCVDEAFPPGVLDDMFDAFVRAIARLAGEDGAVSRSSLVTGLPGTEELRRGTERTVERERYNLGDIVLAGAAGRGDLPAVVSGADRIDYATLLSSAALVASRLAEVGVGERDLVAVAVPRGWHQVAGVLGVVLAGGAYLPVDTTLPDARAAQMAELGRVRAVVAGDRQPPWNRGLPVVPVVEDRGGDRPASPADPEALAYVIYTSGSTGAPKGVAVTHAAAVNTILDINERYGIGCSDRVLAVSSIGFDLSVWDVFGTLAAGATLVCPPPGDLARDPAVWLDLLTTERVTVWNSAPALMQIMVELAELRAAGLPDLRLVLLSGDWVPVGLPDRIRALAPAARVVSLGGATEAAIWSLAYDVDTVDPAWTSVPYGFPLSNQRLLVLDARNRERPVHVPGELNIAGDGVAQGYWQEPESTAEKFPDLPGHGRVYRTGDLVLRRPDGCLVILGRIDRQVKVNGHRIEPGEVDAVLRSLDAVRNCATGTVTVDGARKLVSYLVVQPAADGGDPVPAVREELARRLPAYLVPHLVPVDAVPVTANGKVDWSAVDPWRLGAPGPPEPAAAPVPGPVAGRIQDLLAEQLDGRRPGLEDDLLLCGLDSIGIVRVASALERAFGVRPGLDLVLRDPTVRTLDAFIQQHLMDRAGAAAGDRPHGRGPATIVDPEQRRRYRAELPQRRRVDGTRRQAIAAAHEPATARPPHRGTFTGGGVSGSAVQAVLAELVHRGQDTGPRYLTPGEIRGVRPLLVVRPGRVDGLAAGAYTVDLVSSELVHTDDRADLVGAAYDPFVYRPAAETAACAIHLVADLEPYLRLYGGLGETFAAVEAAAMVQALVVAAGRVPDLALRPIPVVDGDALALGPALDAGATVLHSVLVGVAAPEAAGQDPDRTADPAWGALSGAPGNGHVEGVL
ncbi:amino acid adenylation domain-containing protein [Dactylosporangium roseum]|uniref:Phenyloxazoline synthase MbtB n=1 Tax=Dactylosporangium roseum TaxID=47989 RepID=A0ABY5ZGK6_9ACTN|nr:amino acid adenylation domain-containing protein [Dactylosporangium roseum]UWZ39404.1 amino acid adenylation domain-containing protein [Dactylosporangium roseum]